ncbi:MAG TPA: cation-transporting P-type ATPase, partial [Candidatus Limnocylindrales bacterium]
MKRPAEVGGLKSAEAAARLAAEGPNTFDDRRGRTLIAILAAQLSSPLVLILVAASLVSLAAGDELNATIILAIVAMTAALGFVQEARSESAVAALQARLTLRANVVRDGSAQEIPVHDVVRGDVVILDAGD